MPMAVGEAVRGGGNLIAMSGNDAAFAGGHGMFYSLRQMMGRAVEYRRWVCRAANRGYTGFVSPRSELVLMKPPGKPTISVHRVQLRNDVTMYAKYGTMIETMAVIWSMTSTIILLWVQVVPVWQRRRSHATGR